MACGVTPQAEKVATSVRFTWLRDAFMAGNNVNHCAQDLNSMLMPCWPLPHHRLQVSAQGVAQRDAAVWGFAQQVEAPIVMLLSGGYTRASAAVIVDSIAGLLSGVAAQQHQRGFQPPRGQEPAGA